MDRKEVLARLGIPKGTQTVFAADCWLYPVPVEKWGVRYTPTGPRYELAKILEDPFDFEVGAVCMEKKSDKVVYTRHNGGYGFLAAPNYIGLTKQAFYLRNDGQH